MAISVPPLNRWNSKHIVVAAAIGTLVVVAITIVIIISLAPPQLQFSIENASFDLASSASVNFYNFTLSANNTSRRMEVHYATLNTEIWINPTMWYSADVNMSGFQQGNVQPPLNVTKVPGWAEDYQPARRTESPSGAGWAEDYQLNFTVVVKAKVVFKVGLARTRPYHIRVFCFPVNFHNQTQTPYANCTYL